MYALPGAHLLGKSRRGIITIRLCKSTMAARRIALMGKNLIRPNNNSAKTPNRASSVYIGPGRHEQYAELAAGANRSVSNFVQHAVWFYEAAKRLLPADQFLKLDQGRFTTEDAEKK